MLNELRIVTFDSKRDNRFCRRIVNNTALHSAITPSKLPIVNASVELQQPRCVAGVNALVFRLCVKNASYLLPFC